MLELDDFIQGYIECALWSETDSDGEYLDSNYDYDSITQESMLLIIAECKEFQETNKVLLDQAYKLYQTNYEYSPEAMAGHDYWLTRNGHGAGFWDRGLDTIGEQLTEACKWQSRHLFANDDNMLDYCKG
jgi:hypothetical protein